MNKNNITVGLAICFLLVACNDEENNKESMKADETGLEVVSVPSAVEQADSEDNAPGSQPELGPGVQRLADLAIEHLAGYLDVEKETIEVVQAEFVTWRDSSVGCPQPGYEYLQVLTHGSRIRLSAGKKIYEYHSGGSRPPFLCEEPSDLGPLPYAPGEI